MASIDRVKAAAEQAGLKIEIFHMPASTRTADEAAEACGCKVGQIVKSLVFQGATTDRLFLLLMAGDNRADTYKAAQLAGEPLVRADPRKVRSETGFAIGGVAPIGHLGVIDAFMDQDLLARTPVWAAAGAPNAVFSVEPIALKDAASAVVADLKEMK